MPSSSPPIGGGEQQHREVKQASPRSPTPAADSFPRPSSQRFGMILPDNTKVSEHLNRSDDGLGSGSGAGRGRGDALPAPVAGAVSSARGDGAALGGNGGDTGLVSPNMAGRPSVEVVTGHGCGGPPAAVGRRAVGGGRHVLVSPAYDPADLTPKHRTDVPSWDRCVDMVYHRETRGGDRSARQREVAAFVAARGVVHAAFGRAIGGGGGVRRRRKEEVKEEDKKRMAWGDLPSAVRLGICDALIEAAGLDTTRPVRTTRAHVTVDVWPPHSLQTLQPILAQLEPFMQASFATHADMLATILVRFSFLLVLSPFIRPESSMNRVATAWLPRYGAAVQNLVVEMDMTRHGWGFLVSSEGMQMSGGTGAMCGLVARAVENMMLRDPGIDVENLIVLCRRFFGSRPTMKREDIAGPSISPSAVTVKPICPDEAIVPIINCIMPLRGRIRSLRTCGLSINLTYSTFHGIFDTNGTPIPHLPQHSYRVAPSTVWPRLPGQTSVIDVGQGRLAKDVHGEHVDPAGPNALRGPVMPPKPVVHPDGSIEIPRPVLGFPDSIGTSTPETSFLTYNTDTTSSHNRTSGSHNNRASQDSIGASERGGGRRPFRLVSRGSFTLQRRGDPAVHERPGSSAGGHRRPSILRLLRSERSASAASTTMPLASTPSPLRPLLGGESPKTPDTITPTHTVTQDTQESQDTKDTHLLVSVPTSSSGVDTPSPSTPLPPLDLPKSITTTTPRRTLKKKASYQQLRAWAPPPQLSPIPQLPQLRHRFSGLDFSQTLADPLQTQAQTPDGETPSANAPTLPTTNTAEAPLTEQPPQGVQQTRPPPPLRKKRSFSHLFRRKASAQNLRAMHDTNAPSSHLPVRPGTSMDTVAASVRHYVPSHPSPTHEHEHEGEHESEGEGEHKDRQDQVAHYAPTHTIEAELNTEEEMAQRAAMKGSWNPLRKASFFNMRRRKEE